MVTPPRPLHTDLPTDIVLNLLWPGLGQLNQGRTGAAVWFALEAAALVVVFASWPDARTVAGSLIAVLTVWSIADVFGAARPASAS